MGSWVQYLSTVPRGIVPAWPTGSLFIQAVGFLAGIAALAMLNFARPILGTVSIFLAVMAIGMSIFFYWLLFTQRKTPIGDIRVQVGDKVLPFKLLTAEGRPFNSDEMQGKRILFKFFRGGW